MNGLNFEHMNINFTITENCNFRCSYCIQGTNQNSQKILSLKLFELILNKIKLEAIDKNIKTIDITLMGGELSTDFKFLKYFEKLTIFQSTDLKIHVNFLTNFSGNILFFKHLDNMFDNQLTFDISIHPEYITNNFLNKINNFYCSVKNNIILNQLYSKNLLMSAYDIEEKLNKNIKVNKIKIRTNGYIDNKNTDIRYCNALYYLISPDGKILDPCRNKKFNFVNFKIVKKIIECSKACPCPFLETEFVQIKK